MKIKYHQEEQNVFQQYTGSNSIVRVELLCIATSTKDAEELVKVLNATQKTSAERLSDLYYVMRDQEKNCTPYVDEIISQLSTIGTEYGSLTRQSTHDKLVALVGDIKKTL